MVYYADKNHKRHRRDTRRDTRRDKQHTHRQRRWTPPAPVKTTLGLALVKAMEQNREELRRHGIRQNGDWIKILEEGGKLSFTSAGAKITLPPVEEKPRHIKRVYLGE